MPPLHPAIVHYPIALITVSVLADLVGYLSNSSTLKATGWWTLIAAATGAALALIAGLFDMNREQIEEEAHKRVHTHMKVGLLLFTVIAALTVWRWSIYAGIISDVGWAYVTMALLVLALTFFQGWLGSELVFSAGVGVAPTGQGTESAADAKKRLEAIPTSDAGAHKHEH